MTHDPREALRPFAACVFNDNGDVTIDTSRLRKADYMAAKQALTASSPGEQKPVAWRMTWTDGSHTFYPPDWKLPQVMPHPDCNLVALYTSPPPAAGCDEAEIETFWQELLDKDDRTSPEEYPDMVLISRDELIEALRRLAVDGLALQGWQDISTAPKDGTRILWSCGDDKMSVIHWPEYELCFEGGYWMPLPPPPAASDREERR